MTTFAPGDHVLVADRPHAGHHRTPGYLKGKRGRIARVHDTFRNPETRAYVAKIIGLLGGAGDLAALGGAGGLEVRLVE